MSEYVLYYSPDSANLVVRIALEECGVSYAARLVDRSVGQQRSPDYLELNPQGLIPVLVDGDVVIFETAAILLYLVDRHEGLGPQRVTSARADLYRWLFFLSNTLHADLRVMFYSQRHVTDQSAVGTLRAGTRLRLLGHLELLDAHMDRHASGYLLESGFSVCDAYLAACCRWMMIYPADEPIPGKSLQTLPRLWPFLERMEQRPAVVRACTAEWIEPPFLTAPGMPRPPVGSVTG